MVDLYLGTPAPVPQYESVRSTCVRGFHHEKVTVRFSNNNSVDTQSYTSFMYTISLFLIFPLPLCDPLLTVFYTGKKVLMEDKTCCWVSDRVR